MNNSFRNGFLHIFQKINSVMMFAIYAAHILLVLATKYSSRGILYGILYPDTANNPVELLDI